MPNILSLSRLIAIPLVTVLAYFEWHRSAALIFALAGLSDYVDGWIARRTQRESKLGILLDPLADKIIILSVMVMLLFLDRLALQIDGWTTDWFAPLLVIVTVGREIAITGLRTIASTIGLVMPADRWGKLKTWIQFFSIFFLLWNQEPWLIVGKILLVVSVITALLSAVRYTLYFLKRLPSD